MTEAEETDSSEVKKGPPPKSVFDRSLAIGGYVFAGSLFVLLVMLFAGDTFGGALRLIGLGPNAQRGVYEDCNLAANSNNPYCSKRPSRSERTWSDIKKTRGKAPAFSLNDF